MTDTELDALFQHLPRPEPSPELEMRVMNGYSRLRRQERARQWAAPVFALAAAGVAAFFLAPEPMMVGDTNLMVPRGVGDRAILLRMEAVVQKNGESERLTPGRSYAAGNTLVFKVTSDRDTSWTLLRNGIPIGNGQLKAGDTVLPVGYTLEAGESSATFTLRTLESSTTLQLPAVAP